MRKKLEYKTKPVLLQSERKAKIVHLIAVYHCNKISNCTGFIVYKTEDLQKWDVQEDTPFINTMLFENEEEAFSMGEYVLKMCTEKLVVNKITSPD